jgi:hypothetical protein
MLQSLSFLNVFNFSHLFIKFLSLHTFLLFYDLLSFLKPLLVPKKMILLLIFLDHFGVIAPWCGTSLRLPWDCRLIKCCLIWSLKVVNEMWSLILLSSILNYAVPTQLRRWFSHIKPNLVPLWCLTFFVSWDYAFFVLWFLPLLRYARCVILTGYIVLAQVNDLSLFSLDDVLVGLVDNIAHLVQALAWLLRSDLVCAVWGALPL